MFSNCIASLHRFLRHWQKIQDLAETIKLLYIYKYVYIYVLFAKGIEDEEFDTHGGGAKKNRSSKYEISCSAISDGVGHLPSTVGSITISQLEGGSYGSSIPVKPIYDSTSMPKMY